MKEKHVKGNKCFAPECRQAQSEHPNSETSPFAASCRLWGSCALLNILLRHYGERQQKYHHDKYLLCGLFFQLILMSVPVSSPEVAG